LGRESSFGNNLIENRKTASRDDEQRRRTLPNEFDKRSTKIFGVVGRQAGMNCDWRLFGQAEPASHFLFR